MEKAFLIEFILTHNRSARKEELEKLSIESLAMIKVRIDLELIQQQYN